VSAACALGVVILPEYRWHEAAALWRQAEELGFEHAWTYDHLAWRTLRDSTWFDAMATLTAAATVTTRLRLGPLVASPNFRHPVPFAKELMSLDDVSRGRVILGVGSGGTGWDATTLQSIPWPARERTERFENFVALLDRLLTDPVTTFEGRYYSAYEARNRPGCVQQPRLPFAVAATGPRGMRVAATCAEMWVTTGGAMSDRPLDAPAGAAFVATQIAHLVDACGAQGRDPASVRRLVLTGIGLGSGLESVESFRDTVGRYAEAGVTDFVVHWPRPDDPFAGDRSRFERIVSSV
jgi:alkanesulfonate monooxygenase SsuD/methylene tetrahydromethanopterin reductase-like flavin-dependent oxidoreductase (luciferase family)